MNRRNFITLTAALLATPTLATAHDPSDNIRDDARLIWAGLFSSSPESYLVEHGISNISSLKNQREKELKLGLTTWSQGELFSLSEIAWLAKHGRRG